MFLVLLLLASLSLSSDALKLNQSFCVDCRHFKKDKSYFLGAGNGKCALFPIIDSIRDPENDDEKIDYLVSGERNDDISYADCVKVRRSETMCGPEGKFFNRKKNCFIDKSCWKLIPNL